MGDATAGHPDFGELEAYRGGEADAATAAHVEACGRCQVELDELELLADQVRAEATPLPPVLAEIERRILWAAQQNAARVRRQLIRRRVQPWAIAASFLLCVATALLWRQQRPVAPAASARLDIVDALALARQVAAAQPADGRFDVNGDGRVDAADVQSIVHHAVTLGDA